MISHKKLARNEYVQVLGEDADGNFTAELFRFESIGPITATIEFYGGMKVYKSATVQAVAVAFGK